MYVFFCLNLQWLLLPWIGAYFGPVCTQPAHTPGNNLKEAWPGSRVPSGSSVRLPSYTDLEWHVAKTKRSRLFLTIKHRFDICNMLENRKWKNNELQLKTQRFFSSFTTQQILYVTAWCDGASAHFHIVWSSYVAGQLEICAFNTDDIIHSKPLWNRCKTKSSLKDYLHQHQQCMTVSVYKCSTKTVQVYSFIRKWWLHVHTHCIYIN